MHKDKTCFFKKRCSSREKSIFLTNVNTLNNILCREQAIGAFKQQDWKSVQKKTEILNTVFTHKSSSLRYNNIYQMPNNLPLWVKTVGGTSIN